MFFFDSLNRSIRLAVPKVVERPRPDNVDGYLALLLSFSVFLVYFRTMAPGVGFGDSGELITAVHTLGVPHPTGFPLYLLLGKGFLLVFPFGSAAFKLNVFSGLFGALTAAAIYYLLRGLGQYKLVALFSGAFLAATPMFWDHATETKVYAMTAFWVALALALAVQGAATGRRRFIWLGFLSAGLAASVHLTGLAALPAVALAAGGANRRTVRSPLVWMLGLLLFILPLLLYLYIPFRAAAGPELNWSSPHTAERFSFYITQGQWGYKEFTRTPLQAVFALRRAAAVLISEFTPAGVLVAAMGVWVLWLRRRVVLFGLLVMTAINIFMVTAYGNQDDIHLVYRYLFPASIVLAVCLALGVQYLLGLAARFFVHQKGLSTPTFTIACSLLLLLVVTGRVATLYPQQDKSRFYYAADHARNILHTLPHGAHLIGFHYLDLFPLLHLTEVEGLRPDVVLHDRAGNLFGPEYDVYNHRLLPPAELEAHLDQVEIRLIRESGAPVFYTHRLNRGVRLEQAGILFAVEGTGWSGDADSLFSEYTFRGELRLPRGRIRQEARQVRAAYHLCQADLYRGWGLWERASDTYEDAVAAGYDSKWALRYAAAQMASGDPQRAEQMLRRAVAIDPVDPGPRMDLGSLLHRLERYEGALEEYGACLRIGAAKAVVHNNIGSVLAALGRNDEARLELERALELDPGYEEARANLSRLQGGES